MRNFFSIIVLAIMAVSASAEYITFETRGINMSQVEKREVLYIGGYREYQKSLAEIQKNVAVNGALGLTQGLSTTSSALAKGFYSSALNGAATGIGIGLAIAGIQYIIDENADERRFIKLETLTMKNGESRLYYKIIFTRFNTIALNEAIEILNYKDADNTTY